MLLASPVYGSLLQQAASRHATLSPSGFAEANKSEFFWPITHLAGGFDHSGEGHVRTRIKIEDEPAWHFWLFRFAIPGMQFDAANLRDGDEPLDTIDLQVRFFIAEDSDHFEQARRSMRCMPLEKLLTPNAIRGSDDRTWPALDMFDEPRAHGFIILRKLDLDHRLIITGIGPQRFLRIGDQYAHNTCFLALPKRPLDRALRPLQAVQAFRRRLPALTCLLAGL
ncbi:hypothetical protein CES85_3790 (plasmid) [Ochrobactrum quorumnocens]|uniref:Uncharacterized protein n=1 Tax=Ochrobactrum quorumnocens TaxID=271865 RepID=A0A248UPZ3_9HYPH|nr:hypothetical protein CES85_3790 [[Ochrobactrum] quorumnocens]